MTALSVMVFTAATLAPAAEKYPVWSPMKGVEPAGAVVMAAAGVSAASASFVHLVCTSKTNCSVDENMAFFSITSFFLSFLLFLMFVELKGLIPESHNFSPNTTPDYVGAITMQSNGNQSKKIFSNKNKSFDRRLRPCNLYSSQ